MGRPGLWLALAIVLVFLIARPHFGSVWKERRTVSSPTGRPTITVLQTDFPSYGICENHVVIDNAAASRIAVDPPRYVCIHRTTLLWGW